MKSLKMEENYDKVIHSGFLMEVNISNKRRNDLCNDIPDFTRFSCNKCQKKQETLRCTQGFVETKRKTQVISSTLLLKRAIPIILIFLIQQISKCIQDRKFQNSTHGFHFGFALFSSFQMRSCLAALRSYNFSRFVFVDRKFSKRYVFGNQTRRFKEEKK